MLSSVCGMEAGDYITWGGGVRAESSLSALRTDTSSCSQQSGMRLLMAWDVPCVSVNVHNDSLVPAQRSCCLCRMGCKLWHGKHTHNSNLRHRQLAGLVSLPGELYMEKQQEQPNHACNVHCYAGC